MTEAPPDPIVRVGLRAFLDLRRGDVALILGLTLLAFLLRFASPIMAVFPDPHGSPPPVQAFGVGVYGVGFPFNGDACPSDTVPVGATEEHHCGYVFDEVYFPVDAAKDLHQPAISYFDPEPPLAKLLMTPPIAAWGFNTWTWRTSTSLFGGLAVGLVYMIALRLRRDRVFASLAALFFCFDGLAFVESRTGVIDMIAVWFVLLAYYTFLLHWQARTRVQWRVTLYIFALALGLAFAAKLTALAPAAVAAALVIGRIVEPWLLSVFPWLRRLAGPRASAAETWRAAAGLTSIRGRLLMGVHVLAAAAVVGLVFVASFSRYNTIEHQDVYFFTGCTQDGGLTADTHTLEPAVMSLAGHSVPDPVRAVGNTVQIMLAGLTYHEQECHSHPYASRWYTWPILEHPVLFYATSSPMFDGTTGDSTVTNMGNPAVWWGAIPALLVCLWRMTRGPVLWRLGTAVLCVGSLALLIIGFHAGEQSDTVTVRVQPSSLYTLGLGGMVLFGGAAVVSGVISRRLVPTFIVFGYLVGWLMWMPGNARRVLFYYHALGSLLFGVLALAYAVSLLRDVHIPIGRWRLPLGPLRYAAVGTVIASFIFFYPVWTGAPISSADHALRTWIDTR